MFGDMMGKLNEMKQKVEDTRNRLKMVNVTGAAGNQKITVICNALREVKDVKIAPKLLQEAPEQLEDLLVMAINSALNQAKNIEDTEMQRAAKGALPNIPGLS